MLKALANLFPGLLQPWECAPPKNYYAESVVEMVARGSRELFQSSRVVWIGTEIPGLVQPWAEIGQRFQRNSFSTRRYRMPL